MIKKVREAQNSGSTYFYLIMFFFLPFILFSFCSAKRGIEPGPDLSKRPYPVKETGEDRTEIQMRRESKGVHQTGIASWYGGKFQGRRTANGEIYDMNKLTAAHKELPFNTFVEVESLVNHRKVTVRINDRGPFVKNRIIDLSYKAAGRIGMHTEGTAPVRLRIVGSRGGKTVPKAEPRQDTIPYKKIEEGEHAFFYMQAGAFSSEENARRMLQRLKEVLPGVSFRIYYDTGFYKVQTEPQYSRSVAENYKKTLAEHGIDVFVKEPTLPM